MARTRSCLECMLSNHASFCSLSHNSQTGKQLMARCRTLLKENEELGKQISQGRIAKLEGEIALEKKLVEEMRVAQNGKGLPLHSSKLSLWLRCVYNINGSAYLICFHFTLCCNYVGGMFPCHN